MSPMLFLLAFRFAPLEFLIEHKGHYRTPIILYKRGIVEQITILARVKCATAFGVKGRVRDSEPRDFLCIANQSLCDRFS